MFGPEYYRIGGYLADDGDAYCPDCWTCETDEEEREAGTSEARLEEMFDGIGLVCCQCGDVLVDLPEEEEEEEEEEESDMEDGLGEDITLSEDGLGLTLVYAVMTDGARTLLHAHSGAFDIAVWVESRRESLRRLGVVRLEVEDTDSDDDTERTTLEKLGRRHTGS